MNVFCFDCDGTLTTSKGPIPISLLKQLIADGHYVFIVSPSARCANLEIPRYTPLLARHLTLNRIKNMIQADRYIYIGDTQNDSRTALIAGWEFYYPQDFLAKFI